MPRYALSSGGSTATSAARSSAHFSWYLLPSSESTGPVAHSGLAAVVSSTRPSCSGLTLASSIARGCGVGGGSAIATGSGVLGSLESAATRLEVELAQPCHAAAKGTNQRANTRAGYHAHN